MLVTTKQHVLWWGICATLTRNLRRYVGNYPSLYPSNSWNDKYLLRPLRVIKFGGKFKSRCNSECPCCKQRLLSQCLKRKGKMSSIYGMENWFWIEKGDKVFIQFEWRIGQNVSPCTIRSLHFTQILSNKSYAIYFFHRHILCSHWVGIRITPATIWYFERVFSWVKLLNISTLYWKKEIFF